MPNGLIQVNVGLTQTKISSLTQIRQELLADWQNKPMTKIPFYNAAVEIECLALTQVYLSDIFLFFQIGETAATRF